MKTSTLYLRWKVLCRRHAWANYCLPKECLEDWWLRPCFDAGETPDAVIERHAAKAGLTHRSTWDLNRASRGKPTQADYDTLSNAADICREFGTILTQAGALLDVLLIAIREEIRP